MRLGAHCECLSDFTLVLLALLCFVSGHGLSMMSVMIVYGIRRGLTKFAEHLLEDSMRYKYQDVFSNI